MENLLSTQGRQARFHIGEPSEIATARRAACDLAGLLGARRLMDVCGITTVKGMGTKVLLKKTLPADAPLITPATIGTFGARLAALPTNAILSEVQQQNRELVDALAALQERQEQLLALTATLKQANQSMAQLNVHFTVRLRH